MARAYVRIPLGARLSFPGSCPFTGAQLARKRVTIWYPKFGFRIPIPILGSIWAEPKVRMRFPASTAKALTESFLRLAGILLIIVLVLSNLMARTRGDQQTTSSQGLTGTSADPAETWIKVFLISIVLYLALKGLRILNLRAVQIIGRDGNLVEVSFRQADFAREFCELNQLTCHPEPFQSRQRRLRRELGS